MGLAWADDNRNKGREYQCKQNYAVMTTYLERELIKIYWLIIMNLKKYEKLEEIDSYFDDIKDAIKARKDGEQKYYVEFSYDNSQKFIQKIGEI